MLNRSKIEELILSGNLSEAADLLIKSEFSNEKVAKESYDLLYRIAILALRKGDVNFAAKLVAQYGYWFDGDAPKLASWNRIIKDAFEQGGFGDLGFRAEFLQPGQKYYSSAPEDLDQLCIKIWQFFRDRNWKLSGAEIKFAGYRHEGGWSSDHFIFGYKVRSIRGHDFFIGFSGNQGLIDGNWNSDSLNSAGVNFIAANKCVMQFYSDHSGPSAWVYTGNNWKAEVAKMNAYSWFDDKPGWESVNCEVPARNRVFIEHLFDPKGNRETIESMRKNGAKNRESLTSTLVKALTAKVKELQRGGVLYDRTHKISLDLILDPLDHPLMPQPEGKQRLADSKKLYHCQSLLYSKAHASNNKCGADNPTHSMRRPHTAK